MEDQQEQEPFKSLPGLGKLKEFRLIVKNYGVTIITNHKKPEAIEQFYKALFYYYWRHHKDRMDKFMFWMNSMYEHLKEMEAMKEKGKYEKK